MAAKNINDLPPETLSNIFLLTLNTHRHPRASWNEPPLKLRLVCRQWRDIVQGTPCLWSTLEIGDFGAHTGSNPRSDSLALQYWIDKSGSVPLDLVIKYDRRHRGYLTWTEEVERVVIIACEHSLRWRTIVAVLHSNGWNRIVERLSGHTPILEDCRVTNALEGYGQLFDIHVTLSSPRLSVLHLESPRRQYNLWITYQQSDALNLVDLDIRQVVVGEDGLRNMLSQSPSLRILKVGLMRPGGQDANAGLVMLAQLHTVVVDATLFWLGDNMVIPFGVLHPPSLTSVEVQCEHLAALVECCAGLSLMLQRSQANLETLRLWKLHHIPNELIQLLKQSPTLNHIDICISKGSCGDNILRALTIPPRQPRHDRPPICPQLQRFVLRPIVWSGSTLSVEAATAMIWSRCHRDRGESDVSHGLEASVPTLCYVEIGSKTDLRGEVLRHPGIAKAVKNGDLRLVLHVSNDDHLQPVE